MILHVAARPQAQPGRTDEFRYLWAKYVSGFIHSQHCARCLVGPYSKLVSVHMGLGPFDLSQEEPEHFDFLYLCGVTGEWATNLHLAVKPSPHPGATAAALSWNGLIFTIEGAEQVEIQPAQQWTLQKPRRYTSCRNWQCGLQHYGQHLLEGSTLLDIQKDGHEG